MSLFSAFSIYHVIFVPRSKAHIAEWEKFILMGMGVEGGVRGGEDLSSSHVR